MKRWRAENRDRIRNYQKQWREANAEHVAVYQKAYHAEWKARDDVQQALRETRIAKTYQLSPDEFNDLWDSQHGECAICHVKMHPRGRKLDSVCVDHNHKTGAVRGLLCRGCNHAIGNFRDDPDIVFSAFEYLTERGFFACQSKDIKHGK